jgi:hypothetical protein
MALIISYTICFCSCCLCLSIFLSVCANWKVVCSLFLRVLFVLSSRYMFFHLKQLQLSSYQGILMITWAVYLLLQCLQCQHRFAPEVEPDCRNHTYFVPWKLCRIDTGWCLTCEVWTVLCQHDAACVHFSWEAIGSHKRTFWSHLDSLCWPYFLPCTFFRINTPAFLSMRPCWNVLCMKCPWKPKRSNRWEYSLCLTISATCCGYLERIRLTGENIHCVWQYLQHAVGILRGFERQVRIFIAFDNICNMLWVSWEDSSDRWEYSLRLTISATWCGYLERIRAIGENIQCIWQYLQHALRILRGFANQHCTLCDKADGPHFDQLVWELTLLQVVF